MRVGLCCEYPVITNDKHGQRAAAATSPLVLSSIQYILTIASEAGGSKQASQSQQPGDSTSASFPMCAVDMSWLAPLRRQVYRGKRSSPTAARGPQPPPPTTARTEIATVELMRTASTTMRDVFAGCRLRLRLRYDGRLLQA
jgi:hypothetical protein